MIASGTEPTSSPRSVGPQPAPSVPNLVRQLRRAAARSRASARLDLFGACALLSGTPVVAADIYRDTFLRTLEQGLGRKPVFFCEACPHLSFDEAWIVALLAAHGRDDRDSLAFLLCSRLHRSARRHVGFLISGMARETGTELADIRLTA